MASGLLYKGRKEVRSMFLKTRATLSLALAVAVFLAAAGAALAQSGPAKA